MPSEQAVRKQDLEAGMNALRTIPYFPADAGAQAAIQRFLAQICPHRAAVEYLCATASEAMSEWCGIKQLRGLLCLRYRPSDGIECECKIPGFRPADYEAKALEKHTAVLAGGYMADEAQRLVSAAKPKLLR